jgi:hypothetical protein
MRSLSQLIAPRLLLPTALLASLAAGCATQTPAAPEPAARPQTTQPSAPHASRPTAQDTGGGSGGLMAGLNRFFQNLTGETPGKYARLTLAENADARRIGINGLVDEKFGRRPPYTTRYADMAELDQDYLVRATAIRALNISRDRSSTKLFIKSLTDPNVPVRLEACKALYRVPDPDAIDPLLRILNSPEEDRDVRIAAAEALGRYKRLEVARALVSMLSNRDFALAWQSRRSLKFMFGRDLLYDESAWLSFLTGPNKPFG